MLSLSISRRMQDIPDDPLLLDSGRVSAKHKLLSGVCEGGQTGNREVFVVPVRLLQLS